MRRPFARAHERAWTLVTLIGIALLTSASPAFAANPHGTYTSGTDTCAVCHAPHAAVGPSITSSSTITGVCDTCHDGTGSSFDTAREFGVGEPSIISSHPVGTEALNSCASCHTPHKGPSEGNDWSLAVGPSSISTGTAVCGGCHGTTARAPLTNMVARYSGTPHDTSVSVPASAAGIKCLACHEPHGSTNASLLLHQVTGISGTTRTIAVSTAGSRAACEACHDVNAGAWHAPAAYALTSHGAVTTSTRAAVVYPGTTSKPGDCANCHDPHGTGVTKYARAAGPALCVGCHDAASAKPADSSYLSLPGFRGSAHSGLTNAGLGTFAGLTQAGDGFAAWESTHAMTPSSPDRPLTADRLTALRSVDGSYAVTALATATGQHDLQMYRFKTPVPAAQATTLAADWVGYGEAVAGYETSVALWNVNTATWQRLCNGVIGAPTPNSSVFAASGEFIDGSGYIWMLADATKLVQSLITDGPTVASHTSTSAVIAWKTAGYADGRVDFGTTSAYGSAVSDASKAVDHEVTIPLGAAGRYHVRVTSTAGGGDSATSADIILSSVMPSRGDAELTQIGKHAMGMGYNAHLSWSLADATWAPYTFQTTVSDGNGWSQTSTWAPGTSADFALDVPYTATTDYTWSVVAKDRDGYVSARSDIGAFQVTDATARPTTPALRWPAAGKVLNYNSTTAVPWASTVMTWTASAAPDGDPVEYRVSWLRPDPLGRPSGVWKEFRWEAWSSSTSQTISGIGAGSIGPASGWQWRVTARDAFHPGLSATSVSRSLTPRDQAVIKPAESGLVLFTWDGAQWDGSTDVLAAGRAGGGWTGAYPQAHPLSDTRVAPSAIQPVNGTYHVSLSDQRDEIGYLDQVKLLAIDSPAGTQVYSNEYDGLPNVAGSPAQTFYTVRDPKPVVSATYDCIPRYRGSTVSGQDISADVQWEDPYLAPAQFSDDNIYTFDLGDLRGAPAIKLLVTGWTDNANVSEQLDWLRTPGAVLPARQLQVQASGGSWVTVKDPLPFPAGYHRTVVYDLTGLFPSGVTDFKVRMRGFARTYIDRVQFDTSAQEPVNITEVTPSAAELRFSGLGTFGVNQYPRFMYDPATALVAGTHTHVGAFTRYGDVLALLTASDDQFAVMDTGDMVDLRFPEPARPVGVMRTVAVRADGFVRMDPISFTPSPLTATALPLTVDPMPFHGMSAYPYPGGEHYPNDIGHLAYLATWNTRVQSVEAQVPVGVAVVTTASLDLWAGDTWLEGGSPGRPDKTAALAVSASSPAAVAPAAQGPSSKAVPPAVDTLHRSLNVDHVGVSVGGQVLAQPAGSRTDCAVCHAVHGGGTAAWDGQAATGGLVAPANRLCTGDGAGGCHSSAASSAGGVNIWAAVTASTNDLTHHDLTDAAQQRSGARIACSDCHNPHNENPAARSSDPTNASVPATWSMDPYVDGAGHLWVQVGNQHDATPPAVSGPTLQTWNTPAYGGIPAVSADSTSPVVLWTTDEPAAVWVDWGMSPGVYTSHAGTDTVPGWGSFDGTDHRITLPGLVLGTTVYWRTRSTDAVGNTTITAEGVYRVVAAPAIPSLNAVPDAYMDTRIGPSDTGTATLSWAVSPQADGDPVEYRVLLSMDHGYSYAPQPWQSSKTYLWGGLTGWHNEYDFFPFYVEARDALHPTAISRSIQGLALCWDLNPSSFHWNCPDLYTFDGSAFRYATGVMGLGSLGVSVDGEYQYPHPVEDTRIEPGALMATRGIYRLALRDNRDEINYVDKVDLLSVDHPKGTQVYVDDLQGLDNTPDWPKPTIHTTRDERPVVSATYDAVPRYLGKPVTGQDITRQVSSADGVFAPAQLYDDNVYTFDLGHLGHPAAVKLVMTGWTEYPTEVESAALKARGISAPPRALQVMDAHGDWVDVAGGLPYIPGFKKTVVLDLSKAFPAGVSDYRVRMRGLARTWIDRIGVDTSADEQISIRTIRPKSASLAYSGVGLQRGSGYPDYSYEAVADPRISSHTGAFTKYGDVTPLTAGSDDAFVVMDVGDALSFEFPEAPAAAAGVDRTFVLHTDGYFKRTAETVDPLPYRGMSTYPYSTPETYPADPTHTAYVATWNTRVKRVPDALTQDLFGAWDLPQSTTAPGPKIHYSLNTDMVSVKVTASAGAVATLAPVQGWTSVGSSLPGPTPSSPGQPTAPAELAKTGQSDATYWRADAAVAEGEYNWQVARFDLGDAATRKQWSSAVVTWVGHGEPDPAHRTTVSLWNFKTGAWDAYASGFFYYQSASSPADFGGDYTITQDTVDGTRTASPIQQTQMAGCLGCHGAARPSSVVMPAGVTNVASAWNTGNPATDDVHGGGDGQEPDSQQGQMYGYLQTGLAPGYSRPNAPLACENCHDPHGSANLYHIPETVNGVSGIRVTDGKSLISLCRACHMGALAYWNITDVKAWHYSCVQCHTGHPAAAGLIPTDQSDCAQCHGHGKRFKHVQYAPGCAGQCHGTVPLPDFAPTL